MPMKTKKAQREYQRRWVARRRADFFADKACKCGSTDRLELDHIDPSKKVTHNIWSWTASRREEEIAKCQVLCYSCHKEKTSQFLKSKRKSCDKHFKAKKKCICH